MPVGVAHALVYACVLCESSTGCMQGCIRLFQAICVLVVMGASVCVCVCVCAWALCNVGVRVVASGGVGPHTPHAQLAGARKWCQAAGFVFCRWASRVPGLAASFVGGPVVCQGQRRHLSVG